ncbi:hypothetical protein MRX96_039233 [Rhipicephalus microplus]
MGLHRGVGSLLTARRPGQQRGPLAVCFRSARKSSGEVAFRLSVRRRLWRALARAVDELAVSIGAVCELCSVSSVWTLGARDRHRGLRDALSRSPLCPPHEVCLEWRGL